MTRFIFIRNVKNHPIGCMAYKLDAARESMEFEVSTHNPKDEFDRKLGREIAEGRLNRHPKRLELSKDIADPLEFAMLYLMLDPTVPQRFKRALDKKLSYLFKAKNVTIQPKKIYENIDEFNASYR